MSSGSAQGLVRYVVYMPHGKRATPTPFYVSVNAEVEKLANVVADHRNFKRHLEDEELTLLKCDVLSFIYSPAELFDKASSWLRKNAEKMTMIPAHRLQRYFPNGPAPEEDEKIDVIAVTNMILESPDVLYALPDRHASKVSIGRLSVIDTIRTLACPSEGVKSEKDIKKWANEDCGIHPHRPTGNYGPSTSLFHPVLARLNHRLMHLDQLGDPSSDYLRLSHKYVSISGDGFDKENLREGELREVVNSLIGEDGRWRVQLEGGTATPDAQWGRNLIRAILELKNVDGLGGNATLQGLLSYAKVLAQPKYEKYLMRLNCPVVIIGIMGSHLEISAAIFTDEVYSDKLLSEDFYIDARQSETVLRVGRIFKAVSLAIAELRDYYEPFEGDDGSIPEPSIAQLYPDPLPAVEGFPIPKLNYLGKLTHIGELLDQKDREAVQRERPYALYRAKMKREKSNDEVEVVVKFTVRYHEEAHRILAESQLAPALHYCIPLLGDMYMVIMDYVEGGPVLFVQEPEGRQAIIKDVETAIKLLHERDLVFGDLRVPNVMSKPGGGAMLIDFDWVGKHRVDKYPASWNNDTILAPGVGRRMLMDKAQDIFMFGRLKAILEHRG